MRVHAYLERIGLINFGVYKRIDPLPSKDWRESQKFHLVVFLKFYFKMFNITQVLFLGVLSFIVDDDHLLRYNTHSDE